jgi:hypothetical protein
VLCRPAAAWNDEADAHAHYNFFRSLLADEYESGLNQLLEPVIAA